MTYIRSPEELNAVVTIGTTTESRGTFQSWMSLLKSRTSPTLNSNEHSWRDMKSSGQRSNLCRVQFLFSR